MIIEQCSPYQGMLNALKDHQTQTQLVNETSGKQSHLMYVAALKQVLHKQRTKGSVPTLKRNVLFQGNRLKANVKTAFPPFI